MDLNEKPSGPLGKLVLLDWDTPAFFEQIFLAFLGGRDLARLEIASSAIKRKEAGKGKGSLTEAVAALGLEAIEPRVLENLGPCIAQDARDEGMHPYPTCMQASRRSSHHDIARLQLILSGWFGPTGSSASNKALLYAHELYLEGAALARAGDAGAAYLHHARAAKLGHVPAIFSAGTALDAGGGGVPRSQEAALGAFEVCAQRGHTSAMFNLGVMYRWGEGCRKDIGKSYEFYHRAATRHGGGREGCPCAGYTAHVAAQNNVGHLLLEWYNRPGVALQYFQEAANNGHPDAQARRHPSSDRSLSYGK